MEGREHIFKMRYIRRVVQVLVLIIFVAVPFFTRNPLDWSPSRIVLGHLPTPTVFPFSGDTWSFSISDFRMIHPVAFIEEAISAKAVYLPLIVALIIPLFMTILLGRFFCSWMCPTGFLLELNQKSGSFFNRIGIKYNVSIKDFRYIILVLALIFGFIFAFPLISVFDPPHVLGRELMYLFTHHAISLSGMGLLLGIVLFETFSTSRAWCNYICPSGGALSLLGSKRLWHIGMDRKKCIHCLKCDEVCPYYLDPMKLADNEDFDWVKCDNCGLCRDVCPTAAISYTHSLMKGRKE